LKADGPRAVHCLADAAACRARGPQRKRYPLSTATAVLLKVVPAHGLTTIFYVLEKARGPGFARQGVEQLISVFSVAKVDEAVVRRALVLAWPDFEDAVCAAAAEASRCQVIVSRDPEGFPDSPIPIMDAGTAPAWLADSPRS